MKVFGETFMKILIIEDEKLLAESLRTLLETKGFDVIRLLFQNPNRNHSKEVILAHVWGYDSNATENHVEVYIGFLRKKLNVIGSNISIISIRKLGYHLEVSE